MQSEAPLPAASSSLDSPGLDAKLMSSEQVALTAVDALLARSPLTPEKQMAVALNAAVLALSRMNINWNAGRGRIIKAACEDLKERLQKFLPQPGRQELPTVESRRAERTAL